MFTVLNFVYFNINGRRLPVGYRVLEQASNQTRVMSPEEAEKEFNQMNLYDTIGFSIDSPRFALYEHQTPDKDTESIFVVDGKTVLMPKKKSDLMAILPLLERQKININDLDLTELTDDSSIETSPKAMKLA